MKQIDAALYAQIIDENCNEFVVGESTYHKQTCILEHYGDVNWEGERTSLICTNEDDTIIFFVIAEKSIHDFGADYSVEISYCGEVVDGVIK